MQLNFSLIALIGLPGSGKTTLIKNLLQCTKSVSFSIIHICYDDNWHQSTGFLIPVKEKRENLLRSLEKLITQIKSFNLLLDSTILNTNNILKNYGLHCNVKLQKISNNENYLLIICDDNHYYRSMRYKLLKLARKYQLNYGQIYVECSLEVAIQRNSERTQANQVPEHIIRNMYKRLECPALDVTNYWKNNTFVINNSSTPQQFTIGHIIDYMELIVNQKPLEFVKNNTQKKVDSLQQQQSKSHQLDLLMRKHIRKLLQNNIPTNKCQEYVKLLNDRRKFLLKQFQTNLIPSQDMDLQEFVEKELRLPSQ